MKVRSVVALAAAQAVCVVCLAQTPSSQTPSGSNTAPTQRDMDRQHGTSAGQYDTQKSGAPLTSEKFVEKAAVIGLAEVELGRLALTKSQDKDVREFAQKMVQDHSANNSKLKAIAEKEKVTLPQQLDAKHQQIAQKLKGLEGAAFDREYKMAMAKGHEEAVALFQEAASGTSTVRQPLRDYAKATLPTLEQHRKLAHNLHGDSPAISSGTRGSGSDTDSTRTATGDNTTKPRT